MLRGWYIPSAEFLNVRQILLMTFLINYFDTLTFFPLVSSLYNAFLSTESDADLAELLSFSKNSYVILVFRKNKNGIL